jgi:Na+/proline symporter
MNLADYLVLVGTMVGIAVYGVWRTRRNASLHTYLHGHDTTGWATIGLSVMATQASAITFLSTPGQAYESGLSFVQNYFGLPLALIVVAAVFLPIYRRLKVYTAYEYLGRRFDSKTRLLGAGLFLLQRGLAAGITIYAPAIIVATVLGWRLDATILLTGALVVIYTVTGGSAAVSLTQKYQMGVIAVGMVAAFVVLVARLPADVSLSDATTIAGGFGRLNAVDFSLDFDKRYTLWSGLFGGLFLSLSYFGTDQSQVSRYLSGGSLRASRLGLMFNAVFKIPMQALILLLGALVFVFYQFQAPPVFFNETAWARHAQAEPADGPLHALEHEFDTVHVAKSASIRRWLAARKSGSPAAEATAHAEMLALQARSQQARAETKAALHAAEPRLKTNDSDYIFITFVLEQLPHGVIGLLVAVIFAAALSSSASELSALGSTTTVDFYRHLLRPAAPDTHYLVASKVFTLLWGAIAIGFALFANLVSNMLEAVNIVGSVFYGVVLGLFLVAFFIRYVRGTAVFCAALLAQALVLGLFFTISIGYLWYNLIGCAACVILSLLFQAVRGNRADGSARPIAS